MFTAFLESPIVSFLLAGVNLYCSDQCVVTALLKPSCWYLKPRGQKELAMTVVTPVHRKELQNLFIETLRLPHREQAAGRHFILGV